ncbi:MAG: penicillin-binding protein 2 [Patescibacteria group bacterium]
MKDNPFKIQEGTVRDGRVAEWLKHRQTGDYLSFEFVPKAQDLGKFISDKKIKITLVLFLAVLFVLLARASYLQIIQGTHFRGIAEGNRLRNDVIPANRGLIYDRFGNLLVRNVSYFFLYLNKQILDKDSVAAAELTDKLLPILKISADELSQRLQVAPQDADKALVYENLPYESAMQLMVLSENYPAIQVNYEPRRQYLASTGLSHVLGYLGVVSPEDLQKNPGYHYNDRLGKDGLEAVYESILKGEDGQRQVEVDALYHEKNIVSMTEPVDGQDLVLTIDNKAEAKLTEIMETQARTNGKLKMAAVVLDAKDGGVLAMVSLPTYDNNIFTTILNNDEYGKIIYDSNTPLLNRVIAGTYPLGSVFKLIVGSAALQEKIIDTSFTVNSTGGVSVSSNFFPDWRSGGHGLTNIYWAIADSVNTFFYTVGGGNNQWLKIGLGVDKIIDYAKRFGLSKLTGIDLLGENPGFLPSKQWKEENIKERWYLGDTYNLSIGQGYLLATPLQAAVYTSYFANFGQAFQPHLVKEIKTKDGVQSIIPKPILTNIVSSDNLNVIRQALRQTVIQGTAVSLQSVSVPVAGKTGTAQFNRNKSPHSWFTAFAPYDDPKIVMTVIVEEGGDTGLAVTVARQFMEWYFSQ